MRKKKIKEILLEARDSGKKYFIVVCNMMTTMFGSVDNIDAYVNPLIELSCDFKLHIDGAFGGFYYPFTDENSQLTFKNPNITSFTLDAHKMAQAPYGTGIFIIRKGYIQNVNTQQASYVEGEDFTLIGQQIWCKCNCSMDDISKKRVRLGGRKKYSSYKKELRGCASELG